MAEKETVCRICSFHYKGCLVFEKRYYTCGVKKIGKFGRDFGILIWDQRRKKIQIQDPGGPSQILLLITHSSINFLS